MTGLLEKLDKVCEQIFTRWDKDQRSGKLLLALGGELQNYNPDVTAIRDALRQHQEWVDALKSVRNELEAARDFFTQYVPLRDHKGKSLHEDWTWGSAEKAIELADDLLGRVPL